MNYIILRYLNFIIAFTFSGLSFLSVDALSSDTSPTKKSGQGNQKIGSLAQKKNNVDLSQTTEQNTKSYFDSICGHCLNPVDARNFTNEEINYCRKSCPNDPDVQDEIYPLNLFAENISRKRDVIYNENIDLIEIIKKLENRIQLEMYRQCDGNLQQLYARGEINKDQKTKSILELQLRQTRKMFHDTKAQNLKMIETLSYEELTEKKFTDAVFKIFIDYDLVRKNCTRDFGLISDTINKAATSKTKRKSW